ncbi:MAG: M42 family peptidase [Treponema sp.]|nr:M42 family peptidase [Treponema sp.]
MDKEQNLLMIKELSDAAGPSGFEDGAVAVIRRYGEGLGVWREDAMRNLRVQRAGPGGGTGGGKPVLMLDAHSDELGFMVRAIRPNGTLDFIPLGSWVPAHVPAHKVRVRNTLGEWLPGIVATKPPHLSSDTERRAAPELSGMVIDLGASSDREIRRDYHIGVAAPVVPGSAFEYLAERDIMMGKALDDRLGCAALLVTLRELAGEDLGVDITGAFSAQEEMGLRGAAVTALETRPDIAICFEGCPADDTLVEPYAVQTALRKGPMLRHIDLRMITNPRFQRFALDLAAAQGIPVQEAVRTGGGTNAGAIHLAAKAVPVIVIGAPVRYIHTHYGIASYGDFEGTVKLACGVIRSLNRGVIAGF